MLSSRTQFIFPVIFTDIQKQSQIQSFKVLSCNINESDNQIIKELNNIDKEVFNDYRMICQNSIFDPLYTVIKSFSENLQARGIKVMEKLADTIHLVTKNVLKEAQKIGRIPEQGNFQIRSAFKMSIYLALFFIYSTTIKKAKPQTDFLGEMLGKDKKKKIKNQGTELSDVTVSRQRMIVQLLKESLYVNYGAIFQKRQVDGQFFKKYCEISVKILESNLVKQQSTLDVIFDILQTIIKAQPQLFNNIRIVLINLIYQSQIIDNLVSFFSKAQSVQLQRLCTQTIITVVIYLVQKTSLNAQAASIKNTKQFLSKLSQRIPKIFFNNLQCFIKLYQHESYLLRNAISDILMNIIKYVLCNQTEQNLRSKDRFITTLLQRIYDKNSFARSYILSILAHLAEDNYAPRKHLTLFLKAGIDRVKDVSINCRKKALQLINVIVDKLCKENSRTLEEITKQLQLSELTLRTLAQQQDRLKLQIDQIDNQDQQRLQQMIGQMKHLKKNIKHQQDKEIQLLQQKQVLNLVDITITNVKLLLGSKNDSDVLETTKLFVKLYKLNFQKSRQILPNIRLLVFSKQKKIRDEVLSTFIHLHLTKKSEQVAKQLTGLFNQAILHNKQDLLSLQQTLQIIISQSLQKNIIIIKPHVYAHMWNQFIHFQRNNSNPDQKRAILTILRVVFNKDVNLIKDQNVDSFLNILKKYIQNQDPDFYIIKEISKIICLENDKILKVSKNFLVAQIYILINCLGSNDNQWYSACQNILTCIFKISDSPQKLSELLIKKLNQKLQRVKTQKAIAQFIFTLSHSCLKTLIHLDALQNKVKSRKQTQMNREQSNQQELDKVMGGVQAQLQRKIQEIQGLAQKILEDPFIKKWVDIIQDIVKNFQNGNQIQVISVLSYCKFMCLSASYCQRKIQPILDLLLKQGINPVVKNNIIIAMGDLLHRFPNIVQPYNHYLYRNLHDTDVGLRKTTLTVLTHLSLNDMIKVRSDLCDIAMLFKDESQQIQGLVKQFFYQLNKKDPKIIFNLIPDALTKFSCIQRFQNQAHFQNFLENILPLMEKQKYSQSLVIKLCQRLGNSLNLLEIKNSAYCLSQININQKGLRKILQNFQTIKNKLQTTEVANYFRNLVTKLKKSGKTQIKSLIDQLQQKVNSSGEQVYNADQIRKKNLQKLQKTKTTRRPAIKKTSTTKKDLKPSRNRIREQDSDQQIDYSQQEQKPKRPSSQSSNSRQRNRIPNQQVPSSSRPKRNARKMQIIQEDSQAIQEQSEESD